MLCPFIAVWRGDKVVLISNKIKIEGVGSDWRWWRNRDYLKQKRLLDLFQPNEIQCCYLLSQPWQFGKVKLGFITDQHSFWSALLPRFRAFQKICFPGNLDSQKVVGIPQQE